MRWESELEVGSGEVGCGGVEVGWWGGGGEGGEVAMKVKRRGDGMGRWREVSYYRARALFQRLTKR